MNMDDMCSLQVKVYLNQLDFQYNNLKNKFTSFPESHSSSTISLFLPQLTKSTEVGDISPLNQFNR